MPTDCGFAHVHAAESEWLQTDKQVLGQVPIPAEAASQALQKGLGVEKAHEVVRKNPGVLAIRVVPSEFNYLSCLTQEPSQCVSILMPTQSLW